MSTSVTWSGSSYTIPAVGDASWGNMVSSYLIALASSSPTGALARTGGAFTLANDVLFGGTYGLQAIYYKSNSASIAASGVLRLAKGDVVAWRNNAGNADLALGINGSDQVTFGTSLVLVPSNGLGTITNADVASAAAIAYSKLNLGSSIVNADVSASAAIAYSKLNLAGAVKLASDVTGLLPAANGGTGVLSTATFPTSGVVVTEAGTETLTNKTLTAPVIASIVNTGTLTLPTATDTLVGRATTDTLTNKTLTSPVIGTIVNTGTLTLPTSTDTLVGRATTDTLTNKTLTSPTIATPVLSSYADLTQVTTPTSPASGKDRLYFKSDDNLYSLTSAGIEKQIGSGAGGSGQKNYIGTSASNTAATWTVYGTVAATTDTTAADLPRATTTASGWKLTPSGSASGTFTVTLATPGVFTATAHGMLTGYTVTFSTTGALPTGLVAGTVYYVNVLSSSTFNVATTMANLIAGTYVATSGSQSGTQSFTFGGAYLRFTLDAADYNVKQQLQWAQNILSGATGDWEVDVYSNTASNYSGTYTHLPLSTDSSGSTTLPNLEGTFRTTFDAPGSAQQYIEIRYNKLAANTHALVGSDLISGPGVSVQGAALGPWTSYSPTIANMGTVTTNYAEWRRNGESIDVRGFFVFAVPTANPIKVPLPTGITGRTGGVNIVLGGSAGTDYTALTTVSSFTPVLMDADKSSIQFSDNISRSILTPLNGSAVIGNGNALIFYATLPTNEYAGSGTVNVASNDQEFVFNTSATTTTDATSFGYGPAGAATQAFAPAYNASIQKRVRFQTPIQDSDVLVLEFQNTAGQWLPTANNTMGYKSVWDSAGTATRDVGTLLQVVNSTDVDVYFYSGADWNPGAPGTLQSWAAESSTRAAKWRVRKMKGGQAVGFGIVQPGVSSGLVSASGVPGFTDGSAAATGYVGEYLTQSRLIASELALTSNTAADVTATALSLTAGDWEISASVLFDRNASTTFTNGEISAAVSRTLNTLPATSAIGVENANGELWIQNTPNASANSAATQLAVVIPPYRVSLLATTTFHLVARAVFATSSCSVYGAIRARRVR